MSAWPTSDDDLRDQSTWPECIKRAIIASCGTLDGVVIRAGSKYFDTERIFENGRCVTIEYTGLIWFEIEGVFVGGEFKVTTEKIPADSLSCVRLRSSDLLLRRA